MKNILHSISVFFKKNFHIKQKINGQTNCGNKIEKSETTEIA